MYIICIIVHISAGTGFKKDVYLKSFKRIKAIKKLDTFLCLIFLDTFFRVLNLFKASEIADSVQYSIPVHN